MPHSLVHFQYIASADEDQSTVGFCVARREQNYLLVHEPKTVRFDAFLLGVIVSGSSEVYDVVSGWNEAHREAHNDDPLSGYGSTFQSVNSMYLRALWRFHYSCIRGIDVIIETQLKIEPRGSRRYDKSLRLTTCN